MKQKVEIEAPWENFGFGTKRKWEWKPFFKHVLKQLKYFMRMFYTSTNLRNSILHLYPRHKQKQE